MPNPQEAEHPDQSVVCGKHSDDGKGTRDTGRDAHSAERKAMKNTIQHGGY